MVRLPRESGYAKTLNSLDVPGSTFFRYGWATQENGPYVQPNLVAKFRDKRSNRQVLLFGDSVDVEPQARAAAKSPYEGDHLNNSEALVRSSSKSLDEFDG